MYGGKGAGSAIGSVVVTGTGVAALPNTSGNTLGTILAGSAVVIGGTALLTQLLVRIMRRAYRA